MRTLGQYIDLKIKWFGLAVLLGCGLCLTAYAQDASLPLPPLPAVSGEAMPALPAPKASAALPEINLPSLPPVNSKPSSTASLPVLPLESSGQEKPLGASLPTLPPVATTAAASTPAMPELPALPPIGGDQAAAPNALPMTTPEVTVDAELPEFDDEPEPAEVAVGTQMPLPLPGQEPAQLPTGLELAGQEMEQSPLIKVVREEEPPKSWQTKLIPQVIPPKTKFNYKRQILPPRINRMEYSKLNRHLPRRMTRDDYAALLFTNVAKNDLEGTRALLNAGTSLYAINGYGETPLQFARRVGASNVAALLVARGAQH